ncbi:uncharacterized protein [Blastocystis hominis]|uniref:Uncharacterized protein n=1 Tax=Blastocystis hominis TaxID=12968 RepID=D8MBG5_BLAHO|nr:uncharacterized protein [Blastocystis hominis]CBK25404.2 unnamed protein product [Blastocystis hominis]|eukprot:XP_012899452.1 uncharacterized protein [Blastocystis hominis]
MPHRSPPQRRANQLRRSQPDSPRSLSPLRRYPNSTFLRSGHPSSRLRPPHPHRQEARPPRGNPRVRRHPGRSEAAARAIRRDPRDAERQLHRRLSERTRGVAQAARLREDGGGNAASLLAEMRAAAVHAVGPHAGISLHPPQGLRGAPPVPQSPRGFRVRLDPKRPEGASGGGAELGEPAAVVLPTERGGRGVQSAGARVLLPAGGAAELHAAAAAAGGHAGAELAVSSLPSRKRGHGWREGREGGGGAGHAALLEVLAVCAMPEGSGAAVHVSAVRTDVLLAGRKKQQVLDELDAHQEDLRVSLDD